MLNFALRSFYTLGRALCAGLALCLALSSGMALAQDGPPSWAQLSPAQQLALQPLAANWSGMPQAQKRKWIKVSENFVGLPPEEKAKLHNNMAQWAALNPNQRAAARLNFAETRALTDGLTPEQRQAQWQAYQLLSPEEKRRLAAGARPLPQGAALAVSPATPLQATPT